MAVAPGPGQRGQVLRREDLPQEPDSDWTWYALISVAVTSCRVVRPAGRASINATRTRSPETFAGTRAMAGGLLAGQEAGQALLRSDLTGGHRALDPVRGRSDPGQVALHRCLLVVGVVLPA